MPFTDGESVGPYRIMEKLGQGGMATVFKAYHPTLDRYVAIKVLHPAFREDENFLARFQREARIVAKLDHPNIVPIYDFAEHNGHPYLVMRYIEGETLKKRLQKEPATLEKARDLMEALGGALAYAHSQEVLHRDIKPSNVILTTEDHVYLTDFGLARMAEAGESTLSRDMMVGTPQYISPEQAKGDVNLDARTDIYSLGVVMYELLVGQVPFQADTPYAVVHDHIFTPLPLPRSIKPNLPEALERFLLKALTKDPDDRFQTIEEMLTTFQAVLGLRPDQVLPETVVLPPAAAHILSEDPLATPIPPTSTPAASSATAEPAQPAPSAIQEVITTRILVSKVAATQVVEKGLEGTLRKKEEINEDAPKVLLPLWRVRCQLDRGRLAKQQVEKHLYFDAHYGKLMRLEGKELRFSDIVNVKAHQVADLDSTAQFKRVPLEEVTSAFFTPRVTVDKIKETARDMFGVRVITAEIVMFPLWEFTVIHKSSRQARKVLIDTTFGRIVEGKLSLIKETKEPPTIPEPLPLP